MIKLDTPKLSFIIPAFNVENYIEDCLLSIINQTEKNIEIIPVNDGSTDKTGEIIDKIARKDKRIRPIHKKNEGVSAARNDGINISNGEYISFVDADDYLAPDYADYMLRLVSDNHAEFGLSENCFTKSNETQVEHDIIKVLSPEDATSLLLGPRVIVGSWNKIYSAELLKSNNIRFSSKMFYGEGLYFITKVSQVAKKTIAGQKKVYYYRRNNYASACTKFRIENFYNGSESIDAIERDLILKTPKVLGFLNWHRCQFKMGTVVRMRSSGAYVDNCEYYQECLAYLRKHLKGTLYLKGVSFYKKALLIGTAINPALMAKLDIMRRKKIQENSISDYNH